MELSGKVVISPRFDYASDFFESLASVCVSDCRSAGYIDTSGQIVNGPLSENRWQFGRTSIRPIRVRGDEYKFPFSARSSEGRVLAFNASSEMYYFLDGNGSRAIDAEYFDAADFSEGLAAVKVNGSREFEPSPGDWGYIDRSGKMVIHPRFSSAGSFGGGIAWVTLDGHSKGCIDKTGAVVIEPRYKLVFPLGEGLAAVSMQENSPPFALVGKKLTCGPFEYSGIGDFSEGLAPCYKAGRSGFLNTKGELVVPMRFAFCRQFSEGLAAVRFPSPTKVRVPEDIGREYWGFINRKGLTQIPPQFDQVGSFRCGLAPVAKRVLTRRGKHVLAWGVIDEQGKEIVPCEFRSIGEFNESIAFVECVNATGYITRDGNWIWPELVRPQTIIPGDGVRNSPPRSWLK